MKDYLPAPLEILVPTGLPSYIAYFITRVDLGYMILILPVLFFLVLSPFLIGELTEGHSLRVKLQKLAVFELLFVPVLIYESTLRSAS